MSLLNKLQAQQTQNARTIEVVSLTVTGIIPLAEDKCPKDSQGNVIGKSQVITKEVGSLFCFTTGIKNAPASFAHGAKASISLEEVEYADKKTGEMRKAINALRCEFSAQDETFRTAGAYGVSVSAK
jgi:hypothetical protein